MLLGSWAKHLVGFVGRCVWTRDADCIVICFLFFCTLGDWISSHDCARHATVRRYVWEILVLCIHVCCSLFCEFLDFLQFSRNSRSGWFLFCLVSRFGGQPFTLLNPPTSALFLLPPHTTTHLPPNLTLPPHKRTHHLFTQDLTLDPAVDILGAVHA